MTAPSRLYPLRKHAEQERLKASPARFCLVPAGRRSGKTELAKRKLIKAAIRARGRLDHNFFAAAPTRDQAKRIYWNDLKAMMPRELIFDVLEGELTIKLFTGTAVSVIGMDKPQRMEGAPWDGGVLDEFANMKPGAWGENVRPALTDRKGWCWLIGVPEGRNHYYDLVQKAKADRTGEWDVFTWKTADIVDAAEVESAKRDLDPVVFQQEYEASFVNFVGRAYYSFDSIENVGDLKWNKRGELIFCFDFNVKPGVACVVQEQTLPGVFELDAQTGLVLVDRAITGTGVIGEVWIDDNSNTPAVCRKLIADWGAHEGLVACYGDATGGARGTAQLSGSDWDLIKSELRAHFKDRVRFDVPNNPTERARVNAVNSRCKNSLGEVHLMVDIRRAPHVVKDLEGVRVLKGGSGEIDKHHDPSLTHVSDALGYYVNRKFPVNRGGASVTPLRA